MSSGFRRQSRRTFLDASAVVAAGSLAGRDGQGQNLVAPAGTEIRQASGVKVGEVTDRSAIVWMRVTRSATRNQAGLVMKGHIAGGIPPAVTVPVEQLEGACPGAPGRVRVRYGRRENLSDARATNWVEVTAQNDFSHQFHLTGLRPATVCHYAAESAGPGSTPLHASLAGRFETAPLPRDPVELTFCAVTCQMYCDCDHPEGFHIYPAIARLNPNFVVFTGDNVYYDSELPRAQSVELARYHWQRMYSLPRHVALLRNVASYWEKDDHDCWDDDGWPGSPARRMLPFTFAEGQQVFRQQVPMGATIYRTFRWGRRLQIWLTDGRDFRTPNNLPDGPQKSIWGPEQKAWLQRTLRDSDATYKVLISPTPLVGPDRANKNDNHSNAGYAHEGNEMRDWLRTQVPDNFFVICGDRHWQYHSVHPTTRVAEFACGPASDQHASGTPGFHPDYHRFHRVKGGFLSVAVTAAGIAVRHHDVHGEIVYEWRQP